MYYDLKEERKESKNVATINYGHLIKYNDRYYIITDYGDHYSDPDHEIEAEGRVLAINIVNGSLMWINANEKAIELKHGVDYKLEIVE